MKGKPLVAGLLGGFIAIAVASMAVKEMQARGAAPVAEVARVTPAEATPAKVAPRFVAYYFHGSMRCVTCRNIEDWSREAITAHFADRIESGDLEWREVNYDQPANEHFRRDFDLAFQSVVLVEQHEGTVVRWQNLHDVWMKVHDGPAAFEQFVVERTADFLKSGGAS
ncbi:MAG: hypothetical protein KF858_04640 [Candidatus Sumerlaeia bacterium]|nr:hypothetical protein [Candidatus Sumerlaeia bacterium]